VNDHDHARAISPEETRHRVLIADVHIVVPVTLELGLEALAVPGCAGFLSEKLTAHVVVDTYDVQPLFGKEPGGLSPDQTGRTSNYRYSHCEPHLASVAPRIIGDARTAP